MAYRRKRAPAEQRFWARVYQENGPLHPYDPSLGRCWPWVGTPGTFHRDGYGYLSYEGKAQLAHRIAWRLVKGEIPEGLELTHSCNYPRCCNPVSFVWHNNQFKHDHFGEFDSIVLSLAYRVRLAEVPLLSHDLPKIMTGARRPSQHEFLSACVFGILKR
jgi:HNH endonuclease